MNNPNVKDLTRKRFGMLVVIERVQNDKYGNAMWMCRCQHIMKEHGVYQDNIQGSMAKSTVECLQKIRQKS